MARFGRSRARAVLPLADVIAQSGRRDTRIGVLARALAKAEALGLVVPESWVVVADAFRHVVQSLPPAHDPGSLIRVIHRSAGVERAARARERVLAAALDSELEREIDAAFESLSELSPWGLAVRASPLLADRGVSRAAGLSKTELAIFDREEVGRAIRRMWALATSETTLQYLRARRIRDVAVAVLLQPVVVARTTAALLTDASAVRDTGRIRSDGRIERLVVAHGGLGSPEVDMARSAVLQFDSSGIVETHRASDERRRLVVEGRRLSWVSTEKGVEPLDDRRISELAEMARRVDPLGAAEVRCVVPEDGDIAVVDVARCHHVGLPALGTAQTLWARVAAGDLPADPMTALSRHVQTLAAVERVQRAFTPQRPKASRALALLSEVDGRSYANLSPLLGLDSSKSSIDAKARVELLGAQWNRDLAPVSPARPSLARAGLKLAQVAAEQRLLADDVNRFERESEQQRRWLSEMDLAILPDDALVTTLHEVRQFFSRANGLFGKTHATAVGSHALLASVLSTADPSRSGWLAHAISAGADVVTAKPATAFCHVAEITRLDPPAAELLTCGTKVRAPTDLPDGPCRRALKQFLVAYGNRGLAEAELGSPRFGEDARPLFAMLGAVLRGGSIDPDLSMSRARALADRRLGEIEPNLSFFETRLVRDITSRHREILRLRERCRQHVARGLGMMRTVAVDVDRRLRRADPALTTESAFHLTFDELALALAKSQVDLAPIVRARRADLEAARAAKDPPVLFRGTPFPVYPTRPEPNLFGLPGSGGVGEGTILRLGERLQGIEGFSAGTVVVVKSLDLGLSPLFFSASAVVAELGTPLSSSVVVARDCAVPVVTGVPGAWVRLRDGERVRVDGDAGTVECGIP